MVVAVVAGLGLLEKVDNISGTTSIVTFFEYKARQSPYWALNLSHSRVQSRHKSLTLPPQ
jgi:hypothetical protein